MNVDDAEEYTQALGQVVAGSWRQIALAERLGVPETLGLSTREWVEDRLGGYVKLSIPERREAALELVAEGMTQREVADVLGVSPGLINADVNERSELNKEEPETEAQDDERSELNNEAPVSPGASDPTGLGRFRCVVVDPPWPVQKIEREVRPHQGRHLDYPTMPLDEIADLPIRDLVDPAGAHVYLWTTHRFLPDALALLVAWGCRYECTFTWRKQVGPTPYSWMYDTEFALFARAGARLDLKRNGLRLSIDAPATGHSRKPDAFYERVVEASPERRLDMFARQQRAGFHVWGDEVPA